MKNQRLCWALTPERQKYLADIIISAVAERAYTRDKLTVTVRAADESYHGKAMLCGKCKTMLAVIEKPKVARGYGKTKTESLKSSASASCRKPKRAI